MEKLSAKVKVTEQIKSYKLYKDGMRSDDKLENNFIKSTNIKYNKVESDVLIGDFLNICVGNTQDNFSRFELKYLYDSFEESGWDFVWKIIDENICYALNVDVNHILDNLKNYDLIKDQLILRPLNFTDNRYELKDCVYRRVGDMALVLYIVVSENANGLNSIKVQKTFLEAWDKEEDEIINEALINSNVRSVPRVYDISTISSHPKYETGAYMALGSTYQLCALGSNTFTTFPYLNGAISFWYPGVQEKIGQMIGGDYYVAFTGIHDFHVHPVSNTNARSVLSNLKHMNRQNPPGEILSRKVYQYKTNSGELVELAL
jgi:hypothetical protein